MSISLPNNKEDKQARLNMLVEQGSITWQKAMRLYWHYCRLYDKTANQYDTGWRIEIGELTAKHLRK